MTGVAMALEFCFSVEHGLLIGRELRIKRLGRLGALDHVGAARFRSLQHFVNALWRGHIRHLGAHRLPVGH